MPIQNTSCPALVVKQDLQGMTLTKILVQRGQHAVTISLEGDDKFSYRIFRVDSQRLSLDLFQVISGIKFTVLPVEHEILRHIRIGQHPKRLRLVFDLNPQIGHRVRYAVVEKLHWLGIRLTE